MKKFILVVGVSLIVVGFIIIVQRNELKEMGNDFSSMSIEIMSIPKVATIKDKTISDNIWTSMQISEWNKKLKFNYEYIPSRIIINIDDKYVFWIDEWDETNEIYKIEKRYGGRDSITGTYEIPIGTVEKIELIMDTSNIEWEKIN